MNKIVEVVMTNEQEQQFLRQAEKEEYRCKNILFFLHKKIG